MASFRPNFHTSLTTKLINEIYYGRTTLHYFLGKVDEWKEYVDDAYVVEQCKCDCPQCANLNGTLITKQFGETSNPHDDPDFAYMNDINIRDNMLYLKKLSSNDASIVVPTHKWIEGGYYTQWDNTKDMTKLDNSNPFYVVNSEYNVYKCLYNNNHSPSTEEPKGISYTVIKTNDNYIWKYMYTIPLVKRNKFFSSKYMPVQQAVDENFYNRGSIESVIVVDEGSGYSADPKTYVTVSASPTGDTAVVDICVDKVTGSIVGVNITHAGSGYETAPIIKVEEIPPKTGRGKYKNNREAILTAYILDGKVDNVTIDDCGLNYRSDYETTLNVSGDGEGCELEPIIHNGKIVDVAVINGGHGYTYLDVSASCSVNTANIEKAQFRAKIGGSIVNSEQGVVEQVAVKGAIYAIEVTNHGGDYNEGSTTVKIEGDGEGCTAHAIIKDRTIERIVVDTYGSGYTTAKITIEDPNRDYPNIHEEAEAYAILPPVNGHGYNAVEELYGNNIAFYVGLRTNELLGKVGQEFRQFGIIEQMRYLDTNLLVKDDESLLTIDVEIDKPSYSETDTLLPDRVVMIKKVPHRIIAKNGTQLTLQQMSSIYRTLEVDDVVSYSDNDGNTRTTVIKEVYNQMSIDKYSGKLLYTNNNLPFYIEDNRTFGLRTYIRL